MIYLDTSALLKLVRAEEHSDALRSYLADTESQSWVSSVLLTVETRRAVQRKAPMESARADLLLTRVGQVGISRAIVESAGRLPGAALRSLDAIHVATALLLGAEVSAFVTYDQHLLAAAGVHGLTGTAPGRTS